MSDESKPVMDPDEYRRRIGASDGSTSQQRAMAASPPETAAVKHGSYLADGVYMRCEQCPIVESCEHAYTEERCVIERRYVEERSPLLMRAIKARHLDPMLHRGLVNIAVWAEIRYMRGVRCVGERGEFRLGGPDGDDYTGVAKHLDKLQAAVIKALGALGLTPEAMLKHDAAGQPTPGSGVLEAAARRQTAALGAGADVVDVEFEEGNGDGPPSLPAGASGELRAAESNGEGEEGGCGATPKPAQQEEQSDEGRRCGGESGHGDQRVPRPLHGTETDTEHSNDNHREDDEQ